MNSIKKSLITRLLLGLGAMFVTLGLLLNYVVGSKYSQDYDRVIESKVQLLTTLTKYMDEGLELDYADESMPELREFSNDNSYFQIWTHDGRVLTKSDSLGGVDLPRPDLSQKNTAALNTPLPDGTSGRLIGSQFVPQIESEYFTAAEAQTISERLKQEPVTLVVAVERETLDASLRNMQLFLAIVGLTTLVLSAITVHSAVSRGLVPLKELQQQVGLLDTSSLEKRLTTSNKVEELQGITVQFNELLKRLEQGFKREKQFSGDVAHELRTPVSEIKALAEVGIRWPDDQHIASGFHQDVLAASVQMETTINNLLALARSEASETIISHRDWMDLYDYMNRSISTHNTETDKQVKFTNKGMNSKVLTVEVYMRLIVDNIIQNALLHSQTNSDVLVSLKTDSEFFHLSVSNKTDNLYAEDLPYLFDRLWRKDKVRRSAQPHNNQSTGIGLALVKNYCDALSYSINTTLQLGIFTITVKGPIKLTPQLKDKPRATAMQPTASELHPLH